jgi:hypothetical protein
VYLATVTGAGAPEFYAVYPSRDHRPYVSLLVSRLTPHVAAAERRLGLVAGRAADLNQAPCGADVTDWQVLPLVRPVGAQAVQTGTSALSEADRTTIGRVLGGLHGGTSVEFPVQLGANRRLSTVFVALSDPERRGEPRAAFPPAPPACTSR